MPHGKQRTEAGVLRFHAVKERATVRFHKFLQKQMIAGGGMATEEQLIDLLTAHALSEVELYIQILKEVRGDAPEPDAKRGAVAAMFDEIKKHTEAALGRRAAKMGDADWLKQAIAGEPQAPIQEQKQDRLPPVTGEDRQQAQALFDRFKTVTEPGTGAKEEVWKDVVAQQMRDYRVGLFLSHDAGCYGKARAKGEPTFTLRAQDASAAGTIAEWIKKNVWRGPPAKIADAARVLQEFEKWANAHGVKQAD